jgi:hypothetical protein
MFYRRYKIIVEITEMMSGGGLKMRPDRRKMFPFNTAALKMALEVLPFRLHMPDNSVAVHR